MTGTSVPELNTRFSIYLAYSFPSVARNLHFVSICICFVLFASFSTRFVKLTALRPALTRIRLALISKSQTRQAISIQLPTGQLAAALKAFSFLPKIKQQNNARNTKPSDCFALLYHLNTKYIA